MRGCEYEQQRYLISVKEYLEDWGYISFTDRIKPLCQEGRNDVRKYSYTVYRKRARKAYGIVTLTVDVVREIVLETVVEQL